MRFRLICDPARRNLVGELLSSRELGPDDAAPFAIVERDLVDGEPAAVVFDPTRLEALVGFLDAVAGHGPGSPATLAVRRGDRIELVQLRLVLYFETSEAGLLCYTATSSGEVRERLFELEERLPAARFVRVSKSAIVNLAAVREVHPWFGRRLLLRFGVEGRQVEVSKNYVRILKERLGL